MPKPRVYSDVKLHRSCQSWFKRLFIAASDSQLYDWLPALLRFPLPDESKRSANPYRWEDPIDSVPMARLRPNRLLSNDTAKCIETAISWLHDRTRSESTEGWRRCAMRLVSAFHSNMMTDNQKKDMGLLLWKDTASDRFPDLPGLDRYNYAHLPVPPQVDVIARIKAYLLRGTPHKVVSAKSDRGISITAGVPSDGVIFDMAWVSKPIMQVPGDQQGSVEWTRKEMKILWSKIHEWWHNERALQGRSRFPNNVAENAENAGIFLRRAVLPNMAKAGDDEWQEILEFLEDTRRHGVYLTEALPYVLLHRASEHSRIERTIIDDLSCDEEEAVSVGSKALRHWIHLAAAGLLESSPQQAAERLLRRVIFRRRVGAIACLDQVAALLVEQPEVFGRHHVDLMISSLPPWSEAISLPIREDRHGDFEEEERPELRALLGSLAGALGAWLSREFPDRPEPHEIFDLRAQYEADPLPEVRRSMNVRD